MNCCLLRPLGLAFFCIAAILGGLSLAAPAQEKEPGSTAIDLDRELEVKVPPDRAKSYYYYALAKWNEDNGDLPKALSDMRTALKFNQNSADVHLALAGLLVNVGNVREAIEKAQAAVRLDPKDPDPHWLLANIYFRSQGRGFSAEEAVRKGLEELETLRTITPQSERLYFALGGAYLQLGESEKAIQAYEKFQSLASGTAAGYNAIAQYYERNGNYEKAIEYLTKSIQSQPDSADSLLMLASLYSKLGRNQEAIPLYRKLLNLTGDNIAVKRQLAYSLVETGDSQEASKLLEELAKAAPQDKEDQKLLGRAKLQSRQYLQATEIFESILKDYPDDTEAQFYLGWTYELSGKPEDALKIFSQLLDDTKGDSEEDKANRRLFQQRLAANYQKLGDHAKAIGIYEELIAANPGPDPELQFLLINAYRLNRQFEKAVSLGRQQHERYPDDTKIGLVYAWSMADSGDIKKGADILLKLLQSNPSDIDLYINLSQIYLLGKRYADAENILRRAEDKELDKQDNEKLKLQLAAVCERKKDFDRAESIFKEILKGNPQNAVALNYIGYMLADRGERLEEAVQYVKEALAIDPNNGAYLDSLGWAFFKLDDLEKAEEYLLQAIERERDDPVIYDHLGDLYFKIGNYQRAQDFWMKSVSNSTEPEEIEKVREKLKKLQEKLAQ